jgi:hypothetical protein
VSGERGRITTGEEGCPSPIPMIPSRATRQSLPPLSPLPVSRAQSPANVPRNTGGQELESSPHPRAQSRSLWRFSTKTTKRAPCKVPRHTIHSKHAVLLRGLRVVWCSAPSPAGRILLRGTRIIPPPPHSHAHTFSPPPPVSSPYLRSEMCTRVATGALSKR